MDVYEELSKTGYDHYGSWALYDVSQDAWDNKTIKTKDVSFEPFAKQLEDPTVRAKKLNTKVILLGLNWASRGSVPVPWGNFHDLSSRSRDYKIAYIVKGTPYEGAYMTDLYKDHSDTKSDKVAKYFNSAEGAEALKKSISGFQEELDILQPTEIICFGGAVFTNLNKLVDKHLLYLDPNKTKIRKTCHYSTARSIDEFKKDLR
ncbi:hypothetical protein [Oenococcus kitaharae]|uniref:Uncharacterized protein n=1 Tax=Oenococcus kitaharae DSM 17330 TaxID=1045004 RepID=G9WIM6_9LACO|nr:hypothetical protein [Oenococcus kitaharae]EHN58165.1 hypothetical protein OKIT_0036 [Oenococcus kitaharae DSM 17330]OEY81634.1 hypothetical protein NT95_09130 [Oenococcus kitaharae]OEY83119.1 hypothetical protein NV75_07230 [Oenococcus kitaharae]OEY84335.1 hypothetical protein NT96_03405 [Oenococcus kitaharae]